MKRLTSIFIAFTVFSLFLSCNMFTNSEQPVKIAFKKGEKVYMRAVAPKLMIEQGETPVIMDFNGVIEQDGKFWVRPSRLGDFLAVFSGQINIIEQKEPNCDGYFESIINQDIFSYSRKMENTQNLGEQIELQEYSFIGSTGEYKIQWRDLPDPIAVENCEVRSITVVQQVSAGEMVSSNQDVILVDLENVAHQFDSNWNISLDEETKVLILQQPN